MHYTTQCIICAAFLILKKILIWRWMHSENRISYKKNDILYFSNHAMVCVALGRSTHNSYGQPRDECSTSEQSTGFLSITDINWFASKPGTFFGHTVLRGFIDYVKIHVAVWSKIPLLCRALSLGKSDRRSDVTGFACKMAAMRCVYDTNQCVVSIIQSNAFMIHSTFSSSVQCFVNFISHK